MFLGQGQAAFRKHWYPQAHTLVCEAQIKHGILLNKLITVK